MLLHPLLALPLPTRFSCPPTLSKYSRRLWLPRCNHLNSKGPSSLQHSQPLAELPLLTSIPSCLVARSANAEGESSLARPRPRSAHRGKQEAGAHTDSRAKEEGSAAGVRSQRSSSAQQQHDANRKQHAKEGKGPRGGTTKRCTEEGRGRPARSESRGPPTGSGLGHKRTREGMASSSNSSGGGSSKRARTGTNTEARRAPSASLDECLQAAESADTPRQLYDALLNLAKQAQSGKGGRRFPQEEGRSVIDAAHMLTTRLLGMKASPLDDRSSSSRSSIESASCTISSRVSSSSPFLRLNSMQLSMTVWGFSQLVGADRRVRSRDLIELVDAIAAHAVGSSVMNTTTHDACMHWSRLLYGIAKMGFSCRDSLAVQQLFQAGAELLPQMLHRKQRCEPQSVSNALWAFATAEYGGSLQQLVAEVASSLGLVMKGANPQAWANTVWALATLHERKVELGDESALAKIVSAGVESMVQQRWRALPQSLSNTLLALAKLDYNPGTTTINTLATAMAEKSSTAAPQALSNTLWALATLDHNPGTTINTLATTMAECSSTAKPQELSNTLWGLAKLGHHPGIASVHTLAAAMAEHSSTAEPQHLSQTLWALATLKYNPGATIQTLVAAMAKRSSTADPQALSNTLWALGSLRWYDPEVYILLAKGLLHSISSSTPDAVGQHFSNALFNCALSCHFDSSVDALASWGSKQDLQQWTEQKVSNTLYAWAILAAIAGGDTARMHALAQHLLNEANRRGAHSFLSCVDGPRHLGKLYGAHLEALHMGLPGTGLTDSKLLQAVLKDTAEWQQEISRQEIQNTSAVATALQGSFEVQAAMVQGYHTLLISHPSCPHGIAVVVTQRYRDYLSHPAGQLYGKAALRLKHIERSCDGLVLCDESELKGSSDVVRDMLLKRIKRAVEEEE